MKQIFYFLLIILLFFSCKIKEENKFYFADGTEIKDENLKSTLEKELLKVYKNKIELGPLKIYTTLNPKLNHNIHRIVSEFGKSYRDSLIKENPKYTFEIDSLFNSKRLFSSELFILENKSGKIASISLSNGSAFRIHENDFYAYKPFGYLLTIEKGVKLDDIYEAREVRSNEVMFHITVKGSYYCFNSGRITKPFQSYPKSDWENLAKRMELNLNLDGFSNQGFQYIQTNTFDLLKFFATIQNNGVYVNPSVIKLVKNKDNQVIYRSKIHKVQAINSEHNIKMKELLKSSSLSWSYKSYYTTHGIKENAFIYSGGSNDARRFVIYSNENYTIAWNLFEYIHYQKFNIKISDQLFYPPYIKDILKELECNHKEESFFHEIQKIEKEEELKTIQSGL